MNHNQPPMNHPAASPDPRRHLMGRAGASRALMTAAVAAGALLVPIAAAGADDPGWSPRTPYPYPPEVDAMCGTVTVHVTFPVNKVYQRNATLADGTQIQAITGAETTTFTADAGRSVSLNLSGPGEYITYPNGDVETRNRGQYGNGLSPQQAAQLGVPQMFTTTGLIDFITHPDGSITPIRVPHNVDNVCAMLGL